MHYSEFLISSIKSKFIRSYMRKNGVYKTVRRFKTVSGKRVFEADEISTIIQNGIDAGKPFFVGRLGRNELLFVAKQTLGIQYGLEKDFERLCSNAGFFPKDASLADKYSRLMIEAMGVNDVLGMWYLPLEDYAIANWISDGAVLTELRFLEPWFSENPWTKSLEGKKVLVIHPFDETIRKQYEKRECIFPDKDYLPDFQLKTLKAVQTIAGNKDDRFTNWFEALDYMYEEAMNESFDIALVGCGAYGYPLASMIKKAGKQAIHLGGVLQVMFGIKGKRWEEETNSVVRSLYNENWVRPSDVEIPPDFNKIEEGCYW